jgi:ParB family chromosome partitioning protein
MTEITNIPLNRLTAWEGNVRKVQNRRFLDELAASIKAHGLQQNLVVRKQGKKFAVVAGGQRLEALNLLVETGVINSSHPVPCKIADGEIDATELSLAENVVRDNMHPADQFEAFRVLIDKGAPVDDVAARFGVTPTVVTQRLTLARVSPVILKAYRDEGLTLEEVMAFAVSDDHAAQERVFAGMGDWQGAREIRAALTENDIAATDKRVRLVTLKAYEKAGGAIRRDLFSEGDDGIFIVDTPLLDRLAMEKLDKAAKPVRKEGWKWVEVRTSFDYEERAQFHRWNPERVPLSPEDAARLETLQQEYDAVMELWQDGDEDDPRPGRLDEIEEAVEKLDDREEIWPPETLAIAGAVVTIGHDGEADIERGLIRPEDIPKRAGKAKARQNAGDAASDDDQSPSFSAALTESLSAQRSAALAAELLQHPDIALAAVVHAFASRIILGSRSAVSSLEIAASPQSLHRVEGSKAFAQLEAARETWGQQIPGTLDGLWTWCLEQNHSVLLDLLAFCAATTVNAVQNKSDTQDSGRLHHATRLASALGLDMAAWFTPTTANYFSRISKPQIFEALREARNTPPAPAWEKLKKADLAIVAERETSGTAWLPLLLR